jgi:Flp pilus assembly protein TadG
MLAIIFPALLIMTFTIVQAGLYYHASQRAAGAADRAAAASAAAGGAEQPGIVAAENFLAVMPLGENAGAPDINVELTAGGTLVEVTVTGPIDPIVPIGTWTVEASATATVEEFVPETER